MKMPVKVIVAERQLKLFDFYKIVRKFKNTKSDTAYSFARHILEHSLDYSPDEKKIIIDLLIDFINV